MLFMFEEAKNQINLMHALEGRRDATRIEYNH